MEWLDLYIEGDAHPRRFANPETLRRYLMHVEQFNDKQVQLLFANRRIGPPDVARGFLLRAPGSPVS